MVLKYFPDHLNNTISVSFPPKRIISLVPSITELLADLNLYNEVVGITKFCVHPPEWLIKKKIVGGTKNFHVDTINSLKPDLILANKEENYQEGIEELQQRFPVWISDVISWEDSLRLIRDVGELTDRKEKANELVERIEISLTSVQHSLNKNLTNLSILYLIWKKPWMGAASNTFIDTMLTKLGLKNCLDNSTRYPELSPEQIAAISPDFIFLSSEPYPFNESHVSELKSLSPSSRIVLVDGEMFSWYGSRQSKVVAHFKALLLELADHGKTK